MSRSRTLKSLLNHHRFDQPKNIKSEHAPKTKYDMFGNKRMRWYGINMAISV